jgi:hypothetical protein
MTTGAAEKHPDWAASTLWDDDLWEALLASIAKGRVIPIIGPALSTVEVDGRRISIDRYVAEQLAERLSIGADEVIGEFNLGAIVSAHLRRKGRLDDLYPKINGILAGKRFDPPEALVKLAKVTHFKLFVTTAFDSLLEAALDDVRGDGSRITESIGYVPSEMPDCDLRYGLKQLPAPTVYHIFGKTSALPEYVISDDDLLEYIFALQTDKQPSNLFYELGSHYLLMLGGDFSDWLLRLFLRLAKRQRLSDPRRPSGDREILVDERSRTDPALVGFLSNFSPQTKVYAGGPTEFIDELWRRWSERFAVPAADAPKASGRPIFLSYARQDIAAARALKAGLEAHRFNVWFDENQMAGGEDFDYKIANALNDCAVFMPLISQNTERDLHDAYFRREWHLACERDTRNADRVKFIVPVIVDRTPVGDLRDVPPRFLRKHVISARDGALTAELLETLRSAVDEAR